MSDCGNNKMASVKAKDTDMDYAANCSWPVMANLVSSMLYVILRHLTICINYISFLLSSLLIFNIELYASQLLFKE